MKTAAIASLFALILCFHLPVFAEENTQPTEDEQTYIEWARKLWNSLDRQTGTIELAGGVATLKVPENFYYLSPQDARKVLEEVWGNPPRRDMMGNAVSRGIHAV